MYFALNGALHDAACAAWSLKRVYDGYRPVAAIRFMGQLGQSTDPNGPSYHQNGLALIPGLIELVTPATSGPGQRHAGLPTNAIAILAWPGEPIDPQTQHSGVSWILAADWLPYQKKTFVTPAFPGYISGHSTFSRAAAEVLATMTGSAFFPGGLGSYAISKLTFEQGPSAPVVLQWATYFDAADQAGISRLWGGIHVAADDLTGRRIGALCGRSAWNLARQYFTGEITTVPAALTIVRKDLTTIEITFPTVRGFSYQLQRRLNLDGAFVDDPTAIIRAVDSAMTQREALQGSTGFFRVLCFP